MHRNISKSIRSKRGVGVEVWSAATAAYVVTIGQSDVILWIMNGIRL